MPTERRTTTLTDSDIDKLREMIYSGIAPEEHREHHEAIKIWIDRENRRKDRYDKVKTHMTGWAAVSAVSGMMYTIGTWVRDHIK